MSDVSMITLRIEARRWVLLLEQVDIKLLERPKHGFYDSFELFGRWGRGRT